MLIKKTEFILPPVHDTGISTQDNKTKILHAVQNLRPLPSSDSSMISYSLASTEPDQTNMISEENGIKWRYNSFSDENLWYLIFSMELPLYPPQTIWLL